MRLAMHLATLSVQHDTCNIHTTQSFNLSLGGAPICRLPTLNPPSLENLGTHSVAGAVHTNRVVLEQVVCSCYICTRKMAQQDQICRLENSGPKLPGTLRTA